MKKSWKTKNVIFNFFIDISKIKFIICGDGFDKEKMKLEAQKYPAGKFQFMGFTENIKSILEVLDIFGEFFNHRMRIEKLNTSLKLMTLEGLNLKTSVFLEFRISEGNKRNQFGDTRKESIVL